MFYLLCLANLAVHNLTDKPLSEQQGFVCIHLKCYGDNHFHIIDIRRISIFKFDEEYNLGDTITVEIFNDCKFVDVIGTSKGKGFQGVVKRHGFGGVGQSTHGQDDRARKPGSIGACSYPAKVFKGMRMGGQMGGDRVTTQNLQVLKVIPEQNLLIVKGSFAGCKGSTVLIEK